MELRLFSLGFCFFVSLSFATLSFSTNVSYDGRAILINGERRVLFSGSIHYPRSTPEMWPDLIQKAKDGGLDAIETYIFWNVHEPHRREYDFEGRLDFIRFLKTVQQAGLYAVLRIGPYVCAEWNFGGFPVWLYQMPGVQLRTDNEIYKNEMQNFTTLIVDMIKQESLLAPQGGPIILTQIENEYGIVESSYGIAGKKYLQWCASLAESLGVGVPWIMCKQIDAPIPVINTCNGFYCDNFTPTNPNAPKMWTENWTGWFKAWGGNDPHRPAQDVAFGVARFFQTGGTFQNYYMYHGGTNFGRSTGGPYIATSYDYDAPLDEYGNLRQPKWGHLKQLHAAIKSMEWVLTHGASSSTYFGNGVSATIYNDNGASGCFLSNINTTNDATISFQGNNFFVPAWSVSVLPDCKNEVYNTAKVSTQTSVMVKKSNMAEDEPAQLNWVWRPEIVSGTLQGRGTFTASQLLEQISTTGDASDYLWYMTSLMLSKKDPLCKNPLTLQVNTTGHGLHAFVNGKLVGSQYDSNGKHQFLFKAPVILNEGVNHITLLSVTVGLANSGPKFEMIPTGIVGGPVQLITSANATKDLSANKWAYKIGLNGEDEALFSDSSITKWASDDLPTNRMFTWYKTSFKAPLGEEAVVVDLQSLGKGAAWVNGKSIGRYWTNFTSSLDGCATCDYRGRYGPKRCASECGHPSQRWYHVPRSFLEADNNNLTLFEEIGGTPTEVSFHTVTVGMACGSVADGQTLELSCIGGRTISEIQFASYGDAQGECGSFSKGSCEAGGALSMVQQACIGKSSCSIDATEEALGASNCGLELGKRLVVQASC